MSQAWTRLSDVDALESQAVGLSRKSLNALVA